MAYTWTEFIDQTKSRCALPTSQTTYTTARLLALTNAEFGSRLVPIIDKIREGYYSYDIDTPLNSTGVYDIHSRASGAKIISACLIDDTERYELTRYFERDLEDYNTSPCNYGYYLKRSQLILVPRQPSSWPTLRQTIFLRPPRIVDNESAAQITNINTGTGDITCDTVPTSWTTADTFDMVQQNPHFDTLSLDLTISAITTGSGGVLTFTPAALSSRLAVGDWIGLSGESPVIQAPVEVQPLLSQYVANILLKGQGDTASYKAGVEDAKNLRESILSLISPRSQNEGKKLVNRTGILRRGL